MCATPAKPLGWQWPSKEAEDMGKADWEFAVAAMHQKHISPKQLSPSEAVAAVDAAGGPMRVLHYK